MYKLLIFNIYFHYLKKSTETNALGNLNSVSVLNHVLNNKDS
jgi:hypothetical protein